MRNADEKDKKSLDVKINISYGDETVAKTEFSENSSFLGIEHNDKGEVSVNSINDKKVLINEGHVPVKIKEVMVNGVEMPLIDKSAEVLNIDKLNSFYSENGNDAELTYKYLVNFLRENKNNPEVLQQSISSILKDECMMYDSDKSYKPIARAQANVLEKFMNSNENETDVDGAICTTIHGFMMEALKEANIPASIAYGATSMPHAILIYKPSEGTYIFNNYWYSATVEADNIKDAMKSYYKNDVSMKASGYLQLADGEGFYGEYLYVDESAFGEGIDKKCLTQKSLFGNTIDDKNSLNVNLDVSAKGNSSQRVDFNLADGNIQNTFSVEHKKTNYSEILNNSESIGVKFAHTNISNDNNITVEKGMSSVLSHLSGENVHTNFNVETFGIQGHKVVSADLYNNEDTSVKLAGGVRGIGSLTYTTADEVGYRDGDIVNVTYEERTNDGNIGVSNVGITLLGRSVPSCKAVNGDLRVGVDAGAEVSHNINDNFNVRADITAGVTADLSMHNYTNQIPGILVGTKLNTNLGLGYSNNMLQLNSDLSYSSSNTASFDEKNLGLALNGAYKVNDNIMFGANVKAAYNRGDINLGLFNETIDKNINLNASLYAQVNKNLKVNAGYELNKSLINSRKDYNFNIGVGYSF